MLGLKKTTPVGGFVAFCSVFAVAVWSGLAHAAEIADFVGSYSGSANLVNADGTKTPRDMSVRIEESRGGFNVRWTSTSYRADGRVKEKTYSIDFRPSDRDGIYSAAMTRNVFGHAVQLDPMRGEPFVWGRIDGATMTVYSLFVDDAGGYELQQYDRTLAEGGLMLEFSRLRNGVLARSVTTFLKRE